MKGAARAKDRTDSALRAELLQQEVKLAAIARDGEVLREANQSLIIASADARNLHDAAEMANARQNEALVMLAHELRNHLAPIGMANAMLARVPDPSAELLCLHAIIQRQLAHLSRLLGDLPDAARISSDSGSVFMVPLPLPLPLPVARRILVVEDNLDAHDTLARLLRAEGHCVTSAYDGIAGLGLASRLCFDVLLCDIGLPGMDGLELITRLRATTGAHVPFAIAISGYGRDEDRERAVSAGYGQYFVKPVDVNALLSLVSCEAVSRFIAAAPKPR